MASMRIASSSSTETPTGPIPTATVQHLTITRGLAGGENGGGIANHGTLTLRRVSVRGNTATGSDPTPSRGGGIWNTDTLTLVDSEVTGSTAEAAGGEIFSTGIMLTLTDSRVADNSSWMGGGIHSGTLTLKAGSSVTGNLAHTDAPEGSAIWHSGAGGGIFNTGTVTLDTETIVTANYLTDSTTVSNCASVTTIPNCIS
jgi:fibronectin-binding autotransporter adhesin